MWIVKPLQAWGLKYHQESHYPTQVTQTFQQSFLMLFDAFPSRILVTLAETPVFLENQSERNRAY